MAENSRQQRLGSRHEAAYSRQQIVGRRQEAVTMGIWEYVTLGAWDFGRH